MSAGRDAGDGSCSGRGVLSHVSLCRTVGCRHSAEHCGRSMSFCPSC